MSLARSDDEIEAQISAVIESEESGGSRWPGMTYEQGVRAALDWVTGQQDEPPMEDE